MNLSEIIYLSNYETSFNYKLRNIKENIPI